MSRFITPQNLDQALDAMNQPGAKALAGGTDLMLALRKARQQGGALPELIVDLTRLPELRRCELQGEPYLGAGLSFRFLETDAALGKALPLLSQAAATVGSVQVRHTATLGGNVANASPAADGTAALCALGARAEIASRNGVRHCLLSELITAPGQTNLAANELILGFVLDQLPPKTGQVFAKVGRRQAVSVARLNIAVCLDEKLADPRVVLGACFPSPRRLGQVEKMIAGKGPGPDLWSQAGKAASSNFVDVCGWRSSAGYKVPAIARMVSRALADAWQALGGAA